MVAVATGGPPRKRVPSLFGSQCRLVAICHNHYVLYFTDISRGKSNKAFSTCQFRRRLRTPKIYNSLTINVIQNHPVLHLPETLQMENTQSSWNQPLSTSTFTFHHQLPLPLWPSTFTFHHHCHFHTIQCRPQLQSAAKFLIQSNL